jgi:hypothetical protein
MARVATTYLGIGMWGLGENPGAGTQDPTVIGIGLNDNFKIIDKALGTAHNSDGTHKTDVIDGPMLKTTTADASTIELAGSPLKLRIKDLGVTLAKVATAGATSGQAIIYNGATIVWGAPTATPGALSITTAMMQDDAITAPKISHDNNRTKFNLTFIFTAGTVNTYATHGGVVTTASLAVPMTKAGSITNMRVCDQAGNTNAQGYSYGAKTFAIGDKITVKMIGGNTPDVVKNDTAMSIFSTVLSGNSYIVTLEMELDD